MARKFKEKFLKPSFEPFGHIFVGTVWPVPGSKGNQYSVELTDYGFNCDCMGFPWHGSRPVPIPGSAVGVAHKPDKGVP